MESPSASTSTVRPSMYIDTSPCSASSSSSVPSSALPSPPDSPNSLSSLPSLSSSFFLSSADASPHHLPSSAPDTNLIIPALTLPDALRVPTPPGRAVGTLRVVVLGASADFLLDANDAVVHVAPPEPFPDIHGARRIQASTHWAERPDHCDHDRDRFEPAANIDIIEIASSADLPGPALTAALRALLLVPFNALSPLLAPSPSPSSHSNSTAPAHLHALLSASTTPLTTTLLLLTPGLSSSSRALIAALGPLVPIILVPAVAGSHTRAALPLSTLRCAGRREARDALFGKTQLLREEAAERFVRWFFAEQAQNVGESPDENENAPPTARLVREIDSGAEQEYSGAEREHEELQRAPEHRRLARPSRDRRATIRPRPKTPSHTRQLSSSQHAAHAKLPSSSQHVTHAKLPSSSQHSRRPSTHVHVPLGGDPLHLPSLLSLSLSLLSPVSLARVRLEGRALGWTLVGAFCAGVGVGIGVGLVVGGMGGWWAA